ncbi:hypothetical protein AtNW77_Chr4g0314681 [Arabidopsis thaliana]|uniref:At4g35430 n=4 Tax=Arabidopsis TaxID=3701 RepID=Q3E9Q9_ARATH|nr:uncharacterized protein AT4G35430 [Arabidopsis thaliana]KAG7618514.1 hypothetical protein ISN45_At04g037620 [Arabidopsis thaliana x Arabidopsis arenosa]KAG7622976.1 hypothetical protein ISN44_As04g037080 [Arabidopsis suecica]ABJ17134.1 At4g35430 [Arabidopsis thaliana]AEE86512.1 hypothetical protein AT4G35430 [Arabidopsis thaliana]CAA0397578.1 unnamed protein product [Arabidopsis thaliana]|eukprot:NP_974688.1 hypothetical protein AT4G35430 [Arabidopsis thaliana]
MVLLCNSSELTRVISICFFCEAPGQFLFFVLRDLGRMSWLVQRGCFLSTPSVGLNGEAPISHLRC